MNTKNTPHDPETPDVPHTRPKTREADLTSPEGRAKQYLIFLEGETPAITQDLARDLVVLAGENYFSGTRDDLRNWAGQFANISGTKNEADLRTQALSQLQLMEAAATAFTETNPNPPTPEQLEAMEHARCKYSLGGSKAGTLLSVIKLREGTYPLAVAVRQLRDRIENAPDSKVIDIISAYLNPPEGLNATVKTAEQASRKDNNMVRHFFMEDAYPSLTRDPCLAAAAELQREQYEIMEAIAKAKAPEGGSGEKKITYQDCTAPDALKYVYDNRHRYHLSEDDMRAIKEKNPDRAYEVFFETIQYLREKVIGKYPEA